MNKSKFLKKSLAAILAVLMIVAVVPLSAAAANDYKPVGLQIVGPNGEKVSGSGTSFILNLNYTPNPTVTISTERTATGANEKFVVIRETIENGSQVGSENENYSSNPATIPLQVDDDKQPVQFRFYIENNGQRTEDYTIDWTVAAPASSGSATKAVLAGQYEGEINEGNKTITFTVPFGYSGADDYYVDFTGCTTSRITVGHYNTASATATGGTGTVTGTGVIGTNKLKPVPQTLTAETEDGKSDVQYTVYVKEETGLTGIKIGDLETEIEIATAANASQGVIDEGMETGKIKVYVPSTLTPVDNKVKLIPELTISDPNTNATIQTGSTPSTDWADVVNGKEFDFSYLYGLNGTNADATKNNPTGGQLNLTSTSASGTKFTRTYTIIFVRWEDTELTSVKAVDGSGSNKWQTVDGDISGDDIEIIVPKGADLSDVDLTFTGPRNFGTSASTGEYTSASTAKVEAFNIADTSRTALGSAVFNATGGPVTLNAGINYTKPIQIVVTSDDGKHQKVYTLTIKPIEEDTVAPQITSGALVLNKGASTEATYVAEVTQGDEPTITFTVPHSTTNTEIQNGEYTWARNSKATTITFTKPNSVANSNNGNVEITSATGNAVKYKIVFKRAAARTGKEISNFTLNTELTNYKLAEYNNNRTYDVTVSNGKFTVTVPDDDVEMSMNFTLSDGAKLYRWENDGTSPNVSLELVESADGNDVNGTVTLSDDASDDAEYFVASEELATMITNYDSKLLISGAAGSALSDIDVDIIMNKYSSLISKYTWNVKEEESNLTRLRSFTDLDGKIQSSITSTQEGRHTIELTIPHSYVGKEFFVNYDIAKGAVLKIYNKDADDDAYEVFDGGLQKYTTKVEPEALSYNTNPGFVIKQDGTGYRLYVRSAPGTGSYTDWPVANYDADNSRYENNLGTDFFTLYTVAEDGTTEPYNFSIKKAAAKTGAQVTSLKVNDTVTASIDHTAKTITANVPFGTNLGQIKVELSSSDMALVSMSKATVDSAVSADTDYFAEKVTGTYDLRTPLKITVKSESDLPQVTNVYTLTVNIGSMFTDVPEDAWFAPYVKEAAEKGIVSGLGNGLFGPYRNITRQDFASMTVRMMGVTVDDDATVPFTDAADVSDYARGAVSYLAQEGIIGGYGDGSFKPGNYITRSEAAKILAVALDLQVTGTPTFNDTRLLADWALPYVAACQNVGVFNGDENNNFNGSKQITRAETAKVMVDSLKIK